MALLFSATEDGVSLGKRRRLFLLSIMITVFQSIVLLTIVTESSFPRCMEDKDCRDGEYCASTLFFGRLSPGMCDDCIWTDEGIWKYLEEHPNPLDLIVPFDYEVYVDKQAHCNATDKFPDQCDHLVHNKALLSGAGYFVLLFVAVITLIPVVQDLDQASDERIDMGTRGGYGALYYFSRVLRVHGLPFYVTAASASLILSNPFTGQEFLLNGLAIGFASCIDDMLSFFLVTKERRERVEEVVDRLLDEQDRVRGWKRNRLYGLTMSLTLFVTVAYCEDLMKYFGGSSHTFHRMDGVWRTPCGDIASVLINFQGVVTIIVALVRAVFNERNITWRDVAKDFGMVFAIGFLASYVIYLPGNMVHFATD